MTTKPTPTLGKIARKLRKLKDRGVTREALDYAAGMIWYESDPAAQAIRAELLRSLAKSRNSRAVQS